MAKKDTTPTEALERAPVTALARPSFIKADDRRGTENITTNDIKPPALKLAQGTSKEIKRSEPTKFIEGLREGEFFNSLTREIYGEGPLSLVVVNQLGHRNVLFDPNDKSTVLDFNVPDGDPTTQFTTVGGKRIKPEATLFYDYLVMVVHEGRTEMMTASLKSTQLKKAKDLNTILLGSKMPSFSFLWEITGVPERKGDHAWYGWRFEPKGFVTEAIYKEASDLYDRMLGKKIVAEVDADGGDDAPDHIPF